MWRQRSHQRHLTGAAAGSVSSGRIEFRRCKTHPVRAGSFLGAKLNYPSLIATAADFHPIGRRCCAGFIETVAVVDNQSIKAGDLLVKIDARLPGSSSPIVRGRLPVDCSVLCAFRDDGSSHAEACVTRIPKGAVRIKGGELRRSSQ